jgi:hypothetical protein
VGKTRKKKEPPEQNPSEVPLYTLWDAVRYLRAPIWSVAALTGRFHDWMEPEMFFHRFWRGGPYAMLFEDDLPQTVGHSEDVERISFRRLAALFVRAGVLRALADGPRSGTEQIDRWEGLHRSRHLLSGG